MQQIFEVENIKCGGCMNTIRKKVEALPGVERAKPNSESGTVEVLFDEATVTAIQITDALRALGYPPVGENDLLRTARSFVSCMTGKIN